MNRYILGCAVLSVMLFVGTEFGTAGENAGALKQDASISDRDYRPEIRSLIKEKFLQEPTDREYEYFSEQLRTGVVDLDTLEDVFEDIRCRNIVREVILKNLGRQPSEVELKFFAEKVKDKKINRAQLESIVQSTTECKQYQLKKLEMLLNSQTILPGHPAYNGPGGPSYRGVGGALYDGPGGPAYRGVGGALYDGPGGARYRGVGGAAYTGPGGSRYTGPGGAGYKGVGGNCYSGPGGACYKGPGAIGSNCPAECVP